ncbi:MAG: YfhO family protein [archaeon]
MATKAINRADLPYLLALLAVASIVFIKIFLQDGIIYAIWSDIPSQFAFWKHLAATHFWQTGEFPKWNPYVFSGEPFIGNAQLGFFFPTMLLYLFLGSDRAFGFVFLIGIFLAGAFTYLFMKRISKDRFASLVSAIVFMFSGVMLEKVSRGHPPIIDAIAVFPLIFLFADIFFERRDLKSASALGIALGVQMLAGFPVITVYTLLALALYYGYLSISGKPTLKSELQRIPLNLLPLIIMAGLSAVVILPGLEFLLNSHRSMGMSFLASTRPFSILNLSHLLMPELLGTLLNETCFLGAILCGANLYVGVLPLILALAGALASKDRRPRFFAFLAGFSFLYYIARFPFQYFFYYVIPILRIFRGADWIMFLFAFSVSVLAGFGARTLTLSLNTKDRALMGRLYKLTLLVAAASILASAGILALKGSILSAGRHMVLAQYAQYASIPGYVPLYSIEAYLAKVPLVYSQILNSILVFSLLAALSAALMHLSIGKTGKRFVLVFIIAILLIDVFLLWPKYIQMAGTDALFGPNDVTEFISADNSTFRVLSLVDDQDLGILTQQRTSRFGIYKARGYNPVVLGRYSEYLDTMFGRNATYNPSIKQIHYPVLANLLNAKYIATTEDLTGYELAYSGSLNLYDNIGFLPRAFVAHKSRVLPKGEALAALTSKEFNPTAEVILETGKSESFTDSPSIVSIVSYSPDYVELSVSTGSPGYLVLLDTNYPGWRATVNGKPAPVLYADYAFRAVRVDSGESRVAFEYQPAPYRIGLSLTAFTIALAILLLLLPGKLSNKLK